MEHATTPRVTHPTLLSAVRVQSVSCLDAIIYVASQVNRRRNDQCVNAHGLAAVSRTNWQRLERESIKKKRKKKKAREREGEREVGWGPGGFEVCSDPERCSLVSSIALEESLWGIALQPPFTVTIIKANDRDSSSHLCKLPCLSVTEQNTESFSVSLTPDLSVNSRFSLRTSSSVYTHFFFIEQRN